MSDGRRSRIVIVGGGVAAYSAAATLRREAFAGELVMLCGEASLPYDRPPLSKAFLRGHLSREELLLQPATWYEQHDIDCRTGAPVVGVSVEDRTVRMGDGTRLPYDQLLIATGGRPRVPELPGSELSNVFYLRSIVDSERLQGIAHPGARVCVVGGGFVGLEVAASLRELGVEVVLLEAQSELLGHIVGPEVGHAVAAVHRTHGVDVRLGESVAGFEGTARVEAVRASSGELVRCDGVVVGVGMEPEVDWLAGSPVGVERGVVVDRCTRTSVDGVYAAGDVAACRARTGGTLMGGHWESAVHQGTVAALNMMGQDVHVSEISSFWSDQYEHHFQYTGRARSFDEVVVRGSLARGSFVAFYLLSGTVDAAFGANDARGMRQARKLVLAGATVDRADLADEGTDLAMLTARSGTPA